MDDRAGGLRRNPADLGAVTRRALVNRRIAARGVSVSAARRRELCSKRLTGVFGGQKSEEISQ